MTIDRALELMNIETTCIKRANTCDRNCAKCELVQKDTDLLEAYSLAIGALLQAKAIGKRKENEL